MCKRKTFIVRAIIYSAALFFDNGELEYNEKNMEQVRGLLSANLICRKR